MNDDFTSEIQSDEFASEWEQMQKSLEFVNEFNAYLDEMEKKYWEKIDAQAN